MGKLVSAIRLVRPLNCAMVGFAVVVGATLGAREFPIYQIQSLVLGFFTGGLLTGAAMTINDFYDRQIDKINEPNRPIPSGAIQPNEAIVTALVLMATGLSIAMFTGATPNWQCLVVAFLSWVLAVSYVTKGKKTGIFGNFLVSACVAVPLIYGSIAIGTGQPLTIGIFTVMVFLSNTGREITKGILDVEGDKKNNIKTLAVLYGNRKAGIVAAAFYLSAVSLTPIPWILQIVSIWYIPLAGLTDLGLLLDSSQLLADPARKNARRIKNRTLLWFLTGLMAFMAGTLG